MAHFARLDADNKVVSVLVVPNEQEHRGEEFLRDDLQLGGRWIQTSYNHRIRKQYAGIGYTYDPTADVFISPQPAPWFSLTTNFDWVCPDNINPLTGEEYTTEQMAVIELNRIASGAQMPGDN
jgi:hypothetical protein